MKNNYKSKKTNKISLAICLIIATILLAGCGTQTAYSDNLVKYRGHKYAPLEYPTNVFYYDYNGNSYDNFAEVDGIYPIDSLNWDMIWNGGDLYCIKKHVSEANEYYANDENYTWYYLIDSDEEDNEINSVPIELTAEELDAVYNVENKERDLALFFEDFENKVVSLRLAKMGLYEEPYPSQNTKGNGIGKVKSLTKAKNAMTLGLNTYSHCPILLATR